LSAELAGTGIALVSVPRFESAVRRYGDRMLGRLFLPAELAYARERRTGLQSLAVRLAAKWAGRDALARLGIPPVPPRDLEIVRGRGQAPTLEPRGGTARRLADDPLRIATSLTHDADWALATVWLERAGRRASLSR
jgi:holo-[acyl-carrier protein] synthase